jgi:hypothetical protein
MTRLSKESTCFRSWVHSNRYARASGCKDTRSIELHDISRSHQHCHSSPELGMTICSSSYARSCDFKRLPSGESPIIAREGCSAIVVKSNRHRKVSDLSSQAQSIPMITWAIAARRTCDCAEFDAELVHPLELIQVTCMYICTVRTVILLSILRFSVLHSSPQIILVLSPHHPETYTNLRFQGCLLAIQPCFPSGDTQRLALSQHAHLCRPLLQTPKISQSGPRPSCGHPIDHGRQMSTTLHHAGQVLV